MSGYDLHASFSTARLHLVWDTMSLIMRKPWSPCMLWLLSVTGQSHLGPKLPMKVPNCQCQAMICMCQALHMVFWWCDCVVCISLRAMITMHTLVTTSVSLGSHAWDPSCQWKCMWTPCQSAEHDPSKDPSPTATIHASNGCWASLGPQLCCCSKDAYGWLRSEQCQQWCWSDAKVMQKWCGGCNCHRTASTCSLMYVDIAWIKSWGCLHLLLSDLSLAKLLPTPVDIFL